MTWLVNLWLIDDDDDEDDDDERSTPLLYSPLDVHLFRLSKHEQDVG